MAYAVDRGFASMTAVLFHININFKCNIRKCEYIYKKPFFPRVSIVNIFPECNVVFKKFLCVTTFKNNIKKK